MTLAEFAADAHWRVALQRSRSRAIRLTGITPYELDAVANRLVKEFDAALKMEITGPDADDEKHRASARGTASQPAGEPATQPGDAAVAMARRLTIENWLDRPNELILTVPQAAAMSERVVFATSLLNERIRLDPAVRHDRSLQTALIGQRIRLIALLRGE